MKVMPPERLTKLFSIRLSKAHYQAWVKLGGIYWLRAQLETQLTKKGR